MQLYWRKFYFLKTEINKYNGQKSQMESTVKYPLHPSRMIIETDSTGVYFRFEVARDVSHFPADKIWLHELLSSLDPTAGYSSCMGLPADSGKQMGFQNKSLRKWKQIVS